MARKKNEEEDIQLAENKASAPYSLKSVNALSLDFDKLDKRGVKKFSDKLTKNGNLIKIKETDAPNKAKRSNGVLQKEFSLTFEDDQKLRICVKSDGTIFQVWLNSRVIPLKNTTDMKKAIDELQGLIKKAADIRAKRAAALKNRKIRPKKISVATARKRQTEEARQQLEETQAQIAELQAKIDQEQTGRDAKSRQLDELTKRLEDEKAETPRLEGEIETVKQEIADGEAQEAAEQAQEEKEAEEAAKEEAQDNMA